MNMHEDLTMTENRFRHAPAKLNQLIDKYRFLSIFTITLVTLHSPAASAGQYIKIDAITHAARQFIVAELSGGQGEGTLKDTTITVKPLDPRLRLAACEQALEVYKAPGTRLLGHGTVGVRCSTPQPWSLFVPVHIEKQIPVLTLSRALRRGEIIGAADLVVRKRSSTSIPVSYLRSGDTLIGQQAARDLAPGVVLTRGMFKQKKLVRRGDRVILSMKNGVVAVRVAGIAMADGARGDRIRVKNLSSKRIVDGTVDAENLVLVGSAAIH